MSIKIAIASGKGGTGKTFISVNLFNSLALINKNLCLVDCDAEAPNDLLFFNTKLISKEDISQVIPQVNISNCTFCGKCKTFCTYNAIMLLPAFEIIQIIDDLCHGCGACFVACKFKALTEKKMYLGNVITYLVQKNHTIIEARSNVGVYSPINVIKAAIKKALNYDIAIFDAPPGTSCPFIHTVRYADFVILVTEPTPFGLSDLKQSVETLKVLGKMYGVIINKSDMGNDDVKNYLLSENISLLMEIPYSKETATAYAQGELITLNNKNLAQAFVNMYNHISQNIWK